MGPCKIKWTAEEEAAVRAGVVKHGASKWRVILKDPEFKNVLCARSNIDLKDKWRNMQLTMNGQSRNRHKPVLKKIEKTSRSCDKSVALTSEGSDEDTIVELEPPSSFNEVSQEGGSEKLTRFSLEDIKTVPVDGKLVEVQQGMEYDSAYSNSLREEINVELMRIGLMSPADAAAVAVEAVKKAEAAIAEAEEAEKEAVEAERAAEEAKAFAEKLKKELSEKKARPGYAAFRRGKHWWQ